MLGVNVQNDMESTLSLCTCIGSQSLVATNCMRGAMSVECILGPAHIVPGPVHLTIPHASVKASHLVYGRADSSAGSCNGSELFRLNR